MGNKKIERVLSLMMAFVLLFGMCPVTAFAAETVDVKFIVTAGEEAVAGALISIDETTTGIADENGEAIIAGLEENQEYTAVITAEGYYEQKVSFTADGSDVAAELEPIVLVDVTVTVKEGNEAVQGATVAVKDTAIAVETDEAGQAILIGLEQNRSYTLLVTKKGYQDAEVDFAVNSMTATRGVSVAMTAYEKVTISGKVLCEGALVNGAVVTLYMTDGSTVTATTADTGIFSFADVYKELVSQLVITGMAQHDSLTVSAEEIDYNQVKKYELAWKTFDLTAQVVSDGGTVDVPAGKVRYGATVSVGIEAAKDANDQPTHSIYRITDNDEAVATEALGLTSYIYQIKSMTEEHNISVTFVDDVEEISFQVGADGKVYQENDWGIYEIPVYNIPGLEVVSTEEEGNYSVNVTYTPAENYRVCTAVVDEETENFEDNDHPFENAFETRDAEEKHTYVLSVRLNSFKVSVEPEANITITPADGIVSYNRSATVTIEAPKDQYLTGLQVGGESVAVNYSGNLPEYTLTNIRQDKEVTATFASVEDMPTVTKDEVITVTSVNAIDTPADAVKEQWQVIYLQNIAKAMVTIAGNGYQVSESITGPFTDSIVITETDEIGTLYVLKDGVVSQVDANVKVVKDEDPPVINTRYMYSTYDFERGKVRAIKWYIPVSDADISSGIDRVVYSSTPLKDKEKIKELENKAKKLTADGWYEAEISGKGKTQYYFWAIDKAGNVSDISNAADVYMDNEDPVIDSFTVDHIASYSNGNYAKPGVKFQVGCYDVHSLIDSVMLYIGGFEYKMKYVRDEKMNGQNIHIYEVTVDEAFHDGEPVTGKVSVAVTDSYVPDQDPDNTFEPNTATKTLAESMDLKSNLLTVEDTAPSITGFTVSSEATAEGWYSFKVDPDDDQSAANAITFTFDIKDEGAGLSDNVADYKIEDAVKDAFNVLSASIPAESVEHETVQIPAVDANGDPVLDENGDQTSTEAPTGKISKIQLVLTVTGDAKKAVDSYDLVLKIADRVNNTKQLVSRLDDPDENGNKEAFPELAFSFDNSAPEIVKFDIPETVETFEFEKFDETTTPAHGSVANGENYGYFFKEATNIVVWANDVGSGVKSINVEGTDVGGKSEGTVTIVEFNYNKDAERWYAICEVPANFKGIIRAYAKDEVGNKSVEKAPNGIITETWEEHNKTTHITLTRPNEENPVLDKDGVPVYTTLVYDENGDLVVDETTGKPLTGSIPVNVVIEDAYNGIHSFTYTVTAPHDDAEDLTGTVTLFDGEGTPLYKDGKISDNGIVWTIEEMDQNLVVKVSGDINISYNSNSIVVDVSMLDMANNSSTSATKLSIDDTLPTIEVSHIIPAAAESVNTNAPTEGTVTAKTGDTPYYVGYKNIPADGEDAATYPIYPGSTLLVKITERNLSEETAQELAKTALKLLDDKTADDKIEEVDQVSALKFFGPFKDKEVETSEVDANGNPVVKTIRKDAVEHFKDINGVYDDSVYYLVELRDCNEEARGGTYQTNFLATDLTGHKAELPENFVIDDTAPAISVAYDNNDVKNGKYYDAERTATITIVERNFNDPVGAVAGTASDDGTPFNFPTDVNWTHSEDNVTHVATVSFTADGRYQDFTVTATDLANHAATLEEKEFYVDTTLPEIVIEGVEDQSAYNDVVAPVITYSDTNIDLESVEIVITGANNGEVVYTYAKEKIRNGETVSYEDFLREKPIDDIYTLYVHLVDLAGNEQTEVIQFSCNRFGSVFDLSNIKDILGKYNQKEKDIVVTETNVDPIDLDTARITLIKNGVPVDLVKDQDFSLKSVGGEGSWSQYTYTIFSELFADDGTYSLYFYTVDAAGNVNENIDEAKDAQISFGIDKTKPIATPIDFVSDTQYAVDAKTVSVEIKDNLLLEDVKIYLNGEEVPYVVNGDEYSFEVLKSNSKQNVRIVAVDAAGNEEEILVTDVLVTTNIFARWYNNTPLFIGSMVLLAALLGIGGWRLWLILVAKRNRDEEEA